MKYLIPFALSVAASLAAPSMARADGPGRPAGDAMTETARALYDQAEQAWKDKKWDECRAKTAAAWAVKQHPQIAGLMGECEAHLGLYRDAAEHLTIRLENDVGLPPDLRQELAKLLDEAKRHVATVTIEVNAGGATVNVDGRTVGTSPITAAQFLDPGDHRFEAVLDGKTVSHVAAFAAGRSTAIPLAFTEQGDGASALPRWPGFLMIGFGVGGIAAGGVLAALSNQRSSDSVSVTQEIVGSAGCDDPTNAAACTRYNDLRRQRAQFANASMGTFIAGGALFLVGAIYTPIALTRKPAEGPTAGFTPLPGGGVLFVSGSF